MRTCLGILISKLRLESLYELIRGRLGCPVPVGYNGVPWVAFFETAKLRDVLDTITLAYHAIQAGRVTPSREAERFVQEVNIIFQEQHVAYRADERGVVRFAVDAEFEAGRLATIAELGSRGSRTPRATSTRPTGSCPRRRRTARARSAPRSTLPRTCSR